MTDTPPDRLAVNPRSPHYDAAALERGIGVRFNGVERHNCEEYCISEGWARFPVGKALDRRGNAMTMLDLPPTLPIDAVFGAKTSAITETVGAAR